MEWYSGSGIDDLVVPKYGDLPDTPDSWFKWGTTDLAHHELNSNGKRSSTYDVQMGASIHRKDRYSDSRDSLQQDYQLDDFPGIDQMDNIFMSSLLEDLPLNDTFHKSISDSPSSPNPAESLLTRMVDSENNTKNSKYARTDDMHESLGSEQNEHHLAQVPQVENFSLSEENSASGRAGEDTETSIEEYVLQDLAIVMTQLTEKTRICFRDALYRLAKNSRQHMAGDNETGDVYTEEAPPWQVVDETARSMKSETNSIDRAVANLMYSEMESNVGNTLFTAAADLEQQASRQQHLPTLSNQSPNAKA